jgi:TolB-like protein
MPFRALSSPADESLAFGLADEITTALARFRWMFLIASPSVAVMSVERRDDPRWRELALDFLLEGNVQRRGGQVRVTVRLLDLAAGGEVAWAARFDREGSDILTLQDEIAAEAVARIDPELLLREGRRAAARPPSSATAYDLVLRAIPAIYRLEESSFRAAGQAIEDAVTLDPDYAAAHAWLACWQCFLVGQGWTEDPLGAMARAGVLADRAVALDPADARGLTIAGHVQAFLYHRTEPALELHERALALNPNLPLAHTFCSLALSYMGRHQEAIRRGEQARQLSPFDPHGFFFDSSLMMPHLLLGEFAVAAELGRRAVTLNPVMSGTYKGLLSALGHLGYEEEIAPLRARLLELEPHFTLATAAARSPMRRIVDRELYIEGLRLSGIPA